MNTCCTLIAALTALPAASLAGPDDSKNFVTPCYAPPALAATLIDYANCDKSKVFPIITANDLTCFYNKVALQDPYANCDGSTGKPLITANDIVCFMNAYSYALAWQNTILGPTDPQIEPWW